MINLSYDEIMDIQESATKKLLDYMDRFFKKESKINTVNFYYPDFDEKRTRIAFNVWSSLDYIAKHGKNFIELLLENEGGSLTEFEKQILVERNKCHITLFQIIEIKGEMIYIEDLILRKKHALWEPDVSKIINKSELIFGRVAQVLSHEKFVGDISFMPEFCKDMFLEKVFVDFNCLRGNEPNLSMDEYLKKYSLNLYKIYTECIYELVDFDDEIDEKFSEELEEFGEFLAKQGHLSQATLSKHINNLINIYEYYLYDNDMTLYDLDEIDLKELLKDAVESNIIHSKKDLDSYISTLKKYLASLKDSDPSYSETYDEIVQIGKNRSSFIEPKGPITMPINRNKELEQATEESLNKKAIDFLNDYEKYLSYIENNKVGTTEANKFVKRKHLIEINNLLSNKVECKAPNQIHMPLLHLFYKLSLNYNILGLDKDILAVQPSKDDYFALKENERLSLFIDYIWNIVPWGELGNEISLDYDQDNKSSILECLSTLEPNIYYNYEKVSELHLSDTMLNYFSYMGLLEINTRNDSSQISLSTLGKKVFDTLKANNMKNDGKIIHMHNWKKNK